MEDKYKDIEDYKKDIENKMAEVEKSIDARVGRMLGKSQQPSIKSGTCIRACPACITVCCGLSWDHNGQHQCSNGHCWL